MSYTVTGEVFSDAVTAAFFATEATLTNPTARVRIADLPTWFVDIMRSTGGDIRITTDDYVTRVPLSVEMFDQGAYTGELIFIIPSAISTGLTCMRIIAGNGSATQPVASDTYGSENATNSNVMARWPLDVDGGIAGLPDTTGNGHTAGVQNMDGTNVISAKVNNGQAMNGSDEEIQANSHADLDFDYNEPFMVEFPFRIPSGNQPDLGSVINNMFTKWGGGASGYPCNVRFNNHTFGGSENTVEVARYDQTNNPSIKSTNTYNDDTWHYLCFWGDGGTNIYLKIDDAAVQSTADTTTTTTTNAAILVMGDNAFQNAYMKFDIDEPMIHDVAGSVAYANFKALNILTPLSSYTIIEESQGALFFGCFA